MLPISTFSTLVVVFITVYFYYGYKVHEMYFLRNLVQMYVLRNLVTEFFQFWILCSPKLDFRDFTVASASYSICSGPSQQC